MRAVDSVAAQTWRPHEVILVDDASGDGTLERLQEMAGAYPDHWVRVVALTSNGGPGPARNAGWAVATSPLLAFLDADDAWHPAKIAQQAGWMLAHPEVALSGHETRLFPDRMPTPEAGLRLEPRPVTLAGMLISNRFPTRTVMLRRDLPFRFGGKTLTEDYLLWLQVVAAGFRTVRFTAPLAFSFRPDFSPGGYSGQLWPHEQRELRCLQQLRKTGGIGSATLWIATLFSLLKYLRRELRVALARIRAG